RFAKEYDVKKILGIGGGGCVFEVVNKFDEGKYAVKRITVDPSDDLITKALREVRAMAQLDHPGIVRYNNDEILRKLNSKKRELLCNYSLTDWLSANTSSDSRSLLRMKSWFKQIVSAVEYIHARNFIHRDLKNTFQPCNIMFVESDRLKICDLGIVIERKMENEVEITLTRTGSGTEEYMSPEQRSLDCRLNAKSDVFTLGLILVELCVVM
ncbi:hypothetical protein PENTCL1PPCAC_23892, partial [Pristionchus entomophagus]